MDRLRGAALACLGLALWLSASGVALRARAKGEAEGAFADPSGGEALATLLGGFRGLASDFMWLRAIQMQDEGRYEEISLLCRLILDLQPRFASVRVFQSWNLAYNLAFEADTPGERWFWIKSGLDLLEHEGIPRIPGSYSLYWELGNMYFFRVSKDGHDPLYRYYQEMLAPVPEWCGSEFEFVDKGLWSDGFERYRLYKLKTPARRVELGEPAAAGGAESRHRRMYVVAVKTDAPSIQLVRLPVSVTERTERVRTRDLPSLRPGARLYTDAPDRVAKGGPFEVRYGGPESPVPEQLDGARLIPLPDADRNVTSSPYLVLEADAPMEVWVGWAADERASYRKARELLLQAESKPDCPYLKVSRLRVHALAKSGDADGAFEEFRVLMRTRAPADKTVPGTFRNFIFGNILAARRRGDEKALEKWHKRLQEEFPWWRMSPSETVEHLLEKWAQ